MPTGKPTLIKVLPVAAAPSHYTGQQAEPDQVEDNMSLGLITTSISQYCFNKQ